MCCLNWRGIGRTVRQREYFVMFLVLNTHIFFQADIILFSSFFFSMFVSNMTWPNGILSCIYQDSLSPHRPIYRKYWKVQVVAWAWGRGLGGIERRDYKVYEETSGYLWLCCFSWLWWWFHWRIHISKLIHMSKLNMCCLLYVSSELISKCSKVVGNKFNTSSNK